MLAYKNHIIEEDLNRIERSLSDCQKLYNTSILITGATGMIATYCVYFLLYLNDRYDANIRVTGLVRNKEKATSRFFDVIDREDFCLLVQDVTKPFAEHLKFNYILHMAGSASAFAIVHEPIAIIKANVLGTINVMELAHRNSSCRVLFASTREVYGKLSDDVLTISEDMQGSVNPLDSRSCYPESKRMAENIIATYASNYGADIVIARIAHVYGPGMAINNDGRIMADLLANAINGENIVLKSDGTAKRAFCYITDAISALIKLLVTSEKNLVYNVANEQEEVTILALANMIRDCVTTHNIEVVFCQPSSEEKKGYLEIPRIRLSTEKLKCIGWYPKVSLHEGIRRTLNVMS